VDDTQEKVDWSRQRPSGYEIIEGGISTRHARAAGLPALFLAPLSAHCFQGL
jgi:hypothetical protein